MNYKKLYCIRFSSSFGIQNLISSIRSATTEYVMISDISYQQIGTKDFDIDIDKRSFVVPQILPFSDKISHPFGRKIKHISLLPNLKTQPIMASSGIRPDFIPFAIVGHKSTLLRNIAKCDNTNDLFLELSLILSDKSYSISVHDKWLAAVKLHDFDIKSRERLISRYFTDGKKYFETTEKTVVESRPRVVVNSELTARDGFIKLYDIVNKSDVILTDTGGLDYELCKYNYTSFSINPDIISDYYIALPGSMINGFDIKRTFTQIILPDHNSIGPIFTPLLGPIGSFAVKQFSANINFAPPFTNSSNNLLTAIEIVLSCIPKRILVVSNSMIPALIASGDNSESIKRQTFLTKIVEFCNSNNIEFKILGDLCQLN